MATEKYTTLGQSTLSSGYTSGGTSLVLVAGTSFPSTGNFRVRVDDEFFLVSARTGATLTVVGAQESSIAANHSIAAVVTEVVTAASWDAIRTDQCSIGLYANLPSITGQTAGNCYYTTDSIYKFIFDGAAWQAFALGIPVTIPPTASWTWDTQGTSTVTSTLGNLYLSFQATGVDSMRIYYRTAAATFTMTMLCRVMDWHDTSPQNGIGIVVGDGTKYLNFGPYDATGQTLTSRLQIQYASDRTTIVSNLLTLTAHSINAVAGGAPIWLRLQLDATNLTWSISLNGVNWYQVYQEAKGAHLGLVTRIGVGGYLRTAAELDVISLSGI